MRELTIGGRRIADDTPAYVIAEIGGNHGGSVETCKRLFEAAAECGADAVKLQKRDNRTLFTRALYESPYNSEHAFGATYGEHREALEFGWDDYVYLQDVANSLGLAFGCTAFDLPSADFLDRLGVDYFKIASGDLRNTPLIRQVAGYRKPVIISTGGGTLADVERAQGVLWSARGDYAILQCTAAYPCLPAEMNLRVLAEYPDLFGGLSDHQDGISLAPVAYALGARIFEKHFTLSHTWKGSDQAFSLEPEGLRAMVRALKQTHEALGDGVKCRYPSEEPGLRKMEKSIVAARDLPAGHVLTADDLALKSPGGGLPPYKLEQLIGRQVWTTVFEDEPITAEMLR